MFVGRQKLLVYELNENDYLFTKNVIDNYPYWFVIDRESNTYFQVLKSFHLNFGKLESTKTKLNLTFHQCYQNTRWAIYYTDSGTFIFLKSETDAVFAKMIM